MSNLNINFFKESQATYMAQILGCKVVSLPMKYPGLSLHWKKSFRAVWQKLIDKIQARLPVWKKKCYLGEGAVSFIKLCSFLYPSLLHSNV